MMSSQEKVIELIKGGENVHLTGPAGSGKSTIINTIADDKTLICAPTGAAALLIKGVTCHSAFNLPFGLVTGDEKNKQTNAVNKLFTGGAIERVVLDESSMIRADYFDLISSRIQRVKGNNLPFGGVQVVSVADWFQLAPVVNRKENRYFRRMYDSPYAFDSNTWKEANFQSVVLSKIYRQSDDQQIALLNSLRVKDKYWKKAIDRLNDDWCPINEDPDKITLCNYLGDSDRINKKFYSQIKGEEFTYKAIIQGKFKENEASVDKTINLKSGCKVIICANAEDKSYVNGQRGVVKSCFPNSIEVQLDDGDLVEVVPHKQEKFKYSKLMGSLTKIVDGSFTQLPIRLGWATSVHKSQGQSLDGCNLHLGRGCFAPHQLYVGLSRVRNLKNMNLIRPIQYDDCIVDDRVKQFYESLKE